MQKIRILCSRANESTFSPDVPRLAGFKPWPRMPIKMLSPATNPQHTMSPDLLAPYQAIERTSLQMVQAARRADWAEVARLEALSREQVAQWREHTAARELSPAQQRKKRAALLAILRHDAQVRRLADPTQANLELLLQRPAAAGLH